MVRTQNIRLPPSVVSIRCIKMSMLDSCNSVFVDLPCHLLNKLQQAAWTQRLIMLHHFSSISDGCQLGFVWNWISPYFVIVLLSCCSWPCPKICLWACVHLQVWQVRSLCPRRYSHCPKYQTTEVRSSLIFLLALRYLSLPSGNQSVMVVKGFTHVFQEQHHWHISAIMRK